MNSSGSSVLSLNSGSEHYGVPKEIMVLVSLNHRIKEQPLGGRVLRRQAVGENHGLVSSG